MRRHLEGEEPIGWFVVTGGRSRVDERVVPEALIFVEGEMSSELQSEHVAILQACQAGPLSVLELSAHLGIPVGIMRILLGDLVDKGKVTARNMQQTDPSNDLEFLGRLVDGLSKL